MTERSRQGEKRLAFGVDPVRPQYYSLRQARYDAAAHDISLWAGGAAAEGRQLSVFDVGCGGGVLMRYLQARPHFDAIRLVGADHKDHFDPKRRYPEFILGDVAEGYPEIPSSSFDVVICEQVLEHLPDIEAPLATMARVTKPGGKLIIGVPIFFPPLHLIRLHVLPSLMRFIPFRDLGTHDQAFSLFSLRRIFSRFPELRIVEERGFRIISGGPWRPLENYRWWWRFNRRLGAWFPAACIEVQIILEKRTPTLAEKMS